QMQYYGINIDTNSRSFIKKINDIHIQKEFDNLNRNSKFSIAEVDKNLLLKIIKEKYQKKGITISRFRNFKDHNLKAFNVKKIIENLHKYTRLKKEMNIFNTEENTKYYRDHGNINYDKVYIWNGKYSLDSLLREWIPRELYQIMKKFISRKKKIENILSRWIVKINKWFFDRIWKHRNEKLIKWKLKHNILNKDKRTLMKRKREIRIDKIIKVKEKCDINRIDKYHEIKQLCFFSKNWIRGHSYHVLLILVNKFNTLTD